MTHLCECVHQQCAAVRRQMLEGGHGLEQPMSRSIEVLREVAPNDVEDRALHDPQLAVRDRTHGGLPRRREQQRQLAE